MEVVASEVDEGSSAASTVAEKRQSIGYVCFCLLTSAFVFPCDSRSLAG